MVTIPTNRELHVADYRAENRIIAPKRENDGPKATRARSNCRTLTEKEPRLSGQEPLSPYSCSGDSNAS